MRLLVLGHWSHTGFGVVTKRLGEEFVGRGIDVRILADNYRGEIIRGPLAGRVFSIRSMSDIFQKWSAQAISGTLWGQLDREDDWKPDQVLVIADMSGFTNNIGPQMTQAWLTVPVWHYCPIEGGNLPPSWRDVWNHPGGDQFPAAQFRPVAMTNYGAGVIGDHLGRAIPTIYHGVDTEVFHPVSAAHPIEFEGKVLRSKEQCRAALDIPPNGKLVLRIDRLVPRKRYDLFLRTMVEVCRRDEEAWTLIHCSPIDPPLNLYEEIGRHPREFWPRLKVTGEHDTFQGLSTTGVAVLMNAADLYVSTTGGEGFGLTLAEAAACGVPVITTDFAAAPEVLGEGGVLIPPLHDTHGDVVFDHSQYGMDWAVPDWRGFVDPILGLLDRRTRREAIGRAGRRHVVANFSWSAAADQFVDLFASAVPEAIAA